MGRRRGGSRVLALLALVGLGVGAWLLRDRIPFLAGKAAETDTTTVSLATAQGAEAKLERLRTGGDTAHLSSAELTSLLRYRLGDPLALQVKDPTVTMSGDTVRVTGRFPTDRLPDAPELRRVRSFLPDTADVDLRGGLRDMGAGRVALRVRSVSFAGMPVPQRLHRQALGRVGRRDEPGLDSSEVAIPLPQGVGAVRVEGGRLVLAPRP